MILFKHVYDDVDFAEGLNDFIHFKKVMMCTRTWYLSFFFTQAKILEDKIYTEKRKFFALNL